VYAGQPSHLWIRILISALIVAGILAFALSEWSEAAAHATPLDGADDQQVSTPELSPLIWHGKSYSPVRDGCTPI
jgi:hypothetical protein